MASTIKVDNLEGSSASTVTVPTGQSLVVTDGIGIASIPTITVAKGGTNTTSYTTGDTVYASGATAISKLGIGTARQAIQTNSGATAPEWVNSPQSLMTAAGDVLYASGANTLAKLAKGSDDEVLTLASGVPSWASAGGGAWNLIQVQTASADDYIEFTTQLTSTYDVYKIFLTNIHVEDDDVTLQSQFRQSASYITSGYQYANGACYAPSGNVNGVGSTSAAFMRLNRVSYGNSTGEGVGMEITIWDPLGTDNAKKVMCDDVGVDNNAAFNREWGGGMYNGNQAAMDGIKFYMSGGNITSGEFTIYGLSKS